MQKTYKNSTNFKSPSAAVGNRNALTPKPTSSYRSATAPSSLPLIDPNAHAHGNAVLMTSSAQSAGAASGPMVVPVPPASGAALVDASSNNALALGLGISLGSPGSGPASGPNNLLPAQPIRINRTKWQTVINDQKLRRELDDAIELDDLTQLRSILEKKPKLAHAPNEDGLLSVDLAILLEKYTVAKVLQQNGAVHSDLLYDFAMLETYINKMQDEAALSILQITARMFSSNQQVKGFDKELRVLEKRHRRLKTIRAHLSKVMLPPPPSDLQCEVRSDTSVRVLVHSAQESSVILALRYKIEWSERPDFSDSALQCAVINSTERSIAHMITNLRKDAGRTYYLRAQVYSLRGWSAYAHLKNRYVVLSSWTETELELQSDCTEAVAGSTQEKQKYAARLSIEHSSDEYAATFLMEFDKLFCTITKSKSPLVCKRPQELSQPATLVATAPVAPQLASANSSGALSASNLSLSSIVSASGTSVQLAVAAAGVGVGVGVGVSAGASTKEPVANGFRWFSNSAATYKLTKSVKRGTYLCFVIYNDCRIASTTDEILPLIQVDPHTPSSNPNAELAALQKYVTDIHMLKMVLKCMSRLSVPSSLEFRVKTLNIIADFLSALEPAASPPSNSLGCRSVQSFSVCMSNRIVPYAAHPDTVIFVCCVNCDACGKDATLPSGLKWSPYTRLLRRRPALNKAVGPAVLPSLAVAVTPSTSSLNISLFDQLDAHSTSALERENSLRGLHPTAGDLHYQQRVSIASSMDDQVDVYSCLLTRLDDIVTCAKRLGEPLASGLYLGYVKVRMTPDQMRLICSKQQPLMIPTVKLRDNPHVTKEEWTSLHRLKQGEIITDDYQASVAADFRDALITAASKLHKMVVAATGHRPVEYPLHHALYINELIELNDQVSLILLFPPLDQVFSVSSSLELSVSVNTSHSSHLTEMHLANFEILCAQIYGTSKQQRAVALLSAIDLSIAVMQHVQRSMLNPDDVRAIRLGCEKMGGIRSKLDEFWRVQRWLIDILGKVRDRSKRSPTSAFTLLPIEMLVPPNPTSTPTPTPTLTPTPTPSPTPLGGPTPDGSLALVDSVREPAILVDTSILRTYHDPDPTLATLSNEVATKSRDPAASGTAKAQVSEAQASGSKPETPQQSIEVYIAYFSGLMNEAANVTVPLSAGLTVREIITNVIRHVNKLARESNPENPCYSDNELDSFYMVVVASNKERVLPGTFCPIDLPSPVRSGKFYISRRIKEQHDGVETVL